eukprot:3940858-Rhodomonas_salina.3
MELRHVSSTAAGMVLRVPALSSCASSVRTGCPPTWYKTAAPESIALDHNTLLCVPGTRRFALDSAAPYSQLTRWLLSKNGEIKDKIHVPGSNCTENAA